MKLARRERKSGNLPEVLLWRELRKRPGGYKFRRQHPLDYFSLDFACLEARLDIEVDGEAHGRGDQPTKDAVRDARLGELGLEVLRIPASLVLRDLESAVDAIVAACRERLPLHHSASPNGPPPRSGEVLEVCPEGLIK